jgi:molybdopterin-guanine dinucleotide biosynthesis protein
MHLFKGLDLVIGEGFKHEPVPKIFVPGREGKGLDQVAIDENVIAIVSDMPVKTDLPVFSTADASGVAAFLLSFFHLGSGGGHIGLDRPSGGVG